MTIHRPDHTPAVGDIYEHRYTTPGKRIRLTAFHDHPNPWLRRFETVTIEHPQSPRQVGYCSHVQASRLTTSQFTHIPTPDTKHSARRSEDTDR